MATKYNVKKLNTTDGIRYQLFRGNQVSYSHRAYYKKKSNAQKKANQLNRNL
jgi:hypothetical protein